MKNRTGQILLHITGCAAFLSLPVLLSPDVSWSFRFLRLQPFQEDFVTYTLLLLFFYLHYFFLIPRLFFKQKFIYYTACIIVSYAVISLLPHVIIPGNHHPHFSPPTSKNRFNPTPLPASRQNQLTPPGAGDQPPADRNQPPARDTLQRAFSQPDLPSMQAPQDTGMQYPNRPRGMFWRMPHFEYLFQFMIVLVLSAMIRINGRLKQAEKEKINAELSYLKAQINPHFLFNTLNSIYSSAIEENADNTATAVVKLSGMMRYVISEAHHAYVPLEKELSYISDYIELQKIRLGETVDLHYNVSGNTSGKQIAPLILISFIENAFKHGVNPEENSGIDIEIIIHDSTLHLSVHNNKVKTVYAGVKTNVGLENTRSRLQLLYPSRHELVIKDDEKEFLVMLKMNLQ